MKKLTLSKETIVDLTNAQLDGVAGGATLLVGCNGTNVCGPSRNSLSHPGCICGPDSNCICE